MCVFSAATILHTLEFQTSKVIEILDIVQPIPEKIEDQEKVLQVKTGIYIG